ncbi:symmetrical bis(5'-nucleosyl)-tetraphosphatase [Shewanella sp. SNU WT4]|uniref:symmetrical bis(5'-nucleosyl)-tetraphosphatase n=1 Tax=Shewanella sp. SNU WT4 TaxID=2590015 RepID=UPI001126E0A8|nr:symmetrical bis(5'-nucleosyl)-tetraphosphatase [Shewanella sp. SNU WT4]QDF66179.1 symmetrical bis(5'-nucleosyl)-tetraphosphatase [Shewanella sp. SNU WT4]
MAHYFVGDIQGCYQELSLLLDKVDFNPSKDQLWAVGDLVARGPDSLAVLRLFQSLEDAGNLVLGNHDLHLLAVFAGLKKAKACDNLQPILAAEDGDSLINFLRCQPLMRELPEHKIIMTHAGVPPQWDLETLRRESKQVSEALMADDYLEALIAKMYTQTAENWSESLTGVDRLRYCINALTRMRFLHRDGSLDFECKESPQTVQSNDLAPWFTFTGQLPQDYHIIFGHWAALMGQTDNERMLALDTGCCWGEHLTLYHLEKNERITQQSLR